MVALAALHEGPLTAYLEPYDTFLYEEHESRTVAVFEGMEPGICHLATLIKVRPIVVHALTLSSSMVLNAFFQWYQGP